MVHEELCIPEWFYYIPALSDPTNAQLGGNTTLKETKFLEKTALLPLAKIEEIPTKE